MRRDTVVPPRERGCECVPRATSSRCAHLRGYAFRSIGRQQAAAECERLRKELEKLEKGIGSGQRQLGNDQFLAKAPANVVENLRKQQGELAVLKEKTLSKLQELGCS